MDELLEGSFRGLLYVLRGIVRLLLFQVWDLCFEVVAWYIGWPVCRVLSLGRFPKAPISAQEQESTLSGILVSIVGLLSLFGALFLISRLLGAG